MGWKRQKDTEELIEHTKRSVAQLLAVAAELNAQVEALEAQVKTRNEGEKGSEHCG